MLASGPRAGTWVWGSSEWQAKPVLCLTSLGAWQEVNLVYLDPHWVIWGASKALTTEPPSQPSAGSVTPVMGPWSNLYFLIYKMQPLRCPYRMAEKRKLDYLLKYLHSARCTVFSWNVVMSVTISMLAPRPQSPCSDPLPRKPPASPMVVETWLDWGRGSWALGTPQGHISL